MVRDFPVERRGQQQHVADKALRRLKKRAKAGNGCDFRARVAAGVKRHITFDDDGTVSVVTSGAPETEKVDREEGDKSCDGVKDVEGTKGKGEEKPGASLIEALPQDIVFTIFDLMVRLARVVVLASHY